MTVAQDLAEASQVHRSELLAHCYRMLGSLHDAEDLVQETMLRAWRAAESYDPARASLRTWLYRIATNACLTALEGRKRRSLPAGLFGPSDTPDVMKLEIRTDIPWLEPFPDALFPGAHLSSDASLSRDPAAVIEARDSIRLAFIAALQHLPPRQRAVLILRDVLALPATEVAALLETTTASVNSALQRARDQLAAHAPAPEGLTEPSDAEGRDLLDRYLAAFAAMDVEGLKQTLREDALLQMPPFPEWYLGPEAIGELMRTVFARSGDFRFARARANGQPAIGLYRWRAEVGAYRFIQLQVLTLDARGIARIDGFHDDGLHSVFGLPAMLTGEAGE